MEKHSKQITHISLGTQRSGASVNSPQFWSLWRLICALSCSSSETKTRSNACWRKWQTVTRSSRGDWRRKCEAHWMFPVYLCTSLIKMIVSPFPPIKQPKALWGCMAQYVTHVHLLCTRLFDVSKPWLYSPCVWCGRTRLSSDVAACMELGHSSLVVAPAFGLQTGDGQKIGWKRDSDAKWPVASVWAVCSEHEGAHPGEHLSHDGRSYFRLTSGLV